MADDAPGRHRREGISWVQVMDMFPDDATAEEWFVSIRWPDRVNRPSRGSFNAQAHPTRRPRPWRRRDCRRNFSTKTGTLMQGSHPGFRTWALALFLNSTGLKGVASMKRHRDPGATQKTAWHPAHRIREAWDDGGEPFAGPVEADETYVDGRERNRHARKRLHASRETVGKAIVAGVRVWSTKEVRVKVVDAADMRTLQGFVKEHTTAEAEVHTAEASACMGIGRTHETVNHTAGEPVRDEVHSQGMESFRSVLKRAQKGVFHKLSRKHPGRLCPGVRGPSQHPGHGHDRHYGGHDSGHGRQSATDVHGLRATFRNLHGETRNRRKDALSGAWMPRGSTADPHRYRPGLQIHLQYLLRVQWMAPESANCRLS